jgi:hypothetical protein
MKPTLIFLALTATAMLTACGSDTKNNNSIDRATLPTPEIASFSVAGTSPAQQDFIPVNAGVEEGKFTIDWNIASADAFHMQIFLSHDATLSADDVRIFNNSLCGAVRVNDCLAQDQYICHFSTDNTLKCSDDWESFNQNLNTQGFLTGIPQQAYIIGEACVIADCKTSAIKIEFQ